MAENNRRNARLRREYLYRKGLEGKERAVYENKRKVKEALEQGKTVPTDLRFEADDLQKEIGFDDARTEQAPKSHIDDEYGRAGVIDPKIMLTTSRDPSSRLTQFVKEVRLCFPNSQRINRGGTVIKELVQAARANDVSDIVIVHEHRGEPDGMIVCHLPYAPMSEAYPHLIFHNFSTGLGQRLQNVLKFLFPVPKPDSHRTMSFINRDDTISFRHHVHTKTKGSDQVELAEVGPRFELKLYQLRLGTVCQTEAENEWVLRPYMNTAKKRKVLGSQ
jgi:U3 small nucleolar ribonucleoprotein protein IMP4